MSYHDSASVRLLFENSLPKLSLDSLCALENACLDELLRRFPPTEKNWPVLNAAVNLRQATDDLLSAMKTVAE